ncbi:MAG: hypothetical protein PWP21_92 [Thermosediminibacterales bacterium]|nr:hypothetical protein [Thermosediminibacterales bacterium]
MTVFTEAVYKSLTKKGEELCGDNVAITRTEDSVIVVMADGLGSGVKANILSTLTTKIASTMMEKQASIEEVVNTLAETLPVCKVRKLAYSTFTILKVENNNGNAYLYEFGNPDVIFLKNSRLTQLPKSSLKIHGREIREARFVLKPGDKLFMISDGVVHAGVGEILNLGWQWPNVAAYLERLEHTKKHRISEMVNLLIKACNQMYAGKPGDDTTVVGIQIKQPQYLTIFTGPPEDNTKDKEVVEKLIKSKGKKVVCGGTAANIVSRETGKKIITNIDSYEFDPGIPPTAEIEGIDLVTEGVLTLSRCVEILENFQDTNTSDTDFLETISRKKDGASRLLNLLLNESTHIHFLVGRAVNSAHQNPNLPRDLTIKIKVVKELINLLSKLNKKITIDYY